MLIIVKLPAGGVYYSIGFEFNPISLLATISPPPHFITLMKVCLSVCLSYETEIALRILEETTDKYHSRERHRETCQMTSSNDKEPPFLNPNPKIRPSQPNVTITNIYISYQFVRNYPLLLFTI